MQRWLIVGSGHVARCLMSIPHPGHRQVIALCRTAERASEWRALGVVPLLGDLDDAPTLRRLSGIAEVVFHFAPPPGTGTGDPRTRHLIASLARGAILPRHLVYISTTGVYGNRPDHLVRETTPVQPSTARARRRVAAEILLREFGKRSGCHVSILRAPGIYDADRLPIRQLQTGEPVPDHDSDPWTNHVHARDLARAAWRAVFHGRPNRLYNAVDNSHLRLGEYYDLVARHFGLPPPPRLSSEELKKQISEVRWSFMAESRKIANDRIRRELRQSWYHATVGDFLSTLSVAADTPAKN